MLKVTVVGAIHGSESGIRRKRIEIMGHNGGVDFIVADGREFVELLCICWSLLA